MDVFINKKCIYELTYVTNFYIPLFYYVYKGALRLVNTSLFALKLNFFFLFFQNDPWIAKI